MHAKATQKLGGDLTGGAKIGNYMRGQSLKDINCNSFAPAFGRGFKLQPWTSTPSEPSAEIPSSLKFEFGRKLFQHSLTSSIPKLRELDLRSEEELKEAQESLLVFQLELDRKRIKSQIFSLPDGTIFQWWGRKEE